MPPHLRDSRVDELGVPIHREREVIGRTQDGTGVEIRLYDGQRLRTQYLVGCDGGRSTVRKSAGIEFPGWDATMSYLLGEVEMGDGAEPAWGIRHDAVGVHALSEPTDGGPVRMMVTEQRLGPGTDPALDELRQGLTAIYGTDYGIQSPRWISRSTDMARQAASFRGAGPARRLRRLDRCRLCRRPRRCARQVVRTA